MNNNNKKIELFLEIETILWIMNNELLYTEKSFKKLLHAMDKIAKHFNVHEESIIDYIPFYGASGWDLETILHKFTLLIFEKENKEEFLNIFHYTIGHFFDQIPSFVTTVKKHYKINE